jgi:hypothetical protein
LLFAGFAGGRFPRVTFALGFLPLLILLTSS